MSTSRSGFGRADHQIFQRLESILHAFDHRPELVDDEIKQQIQRVRRADLDAFRATLQTINHTLVAAAAAMANGRDEIAADKHMRLAKFQARFPQLRGTRGDEHVAFIFLELGALVGGNRIFQCQRV